MPHSDLAWFTTNSVGIFAVLLWRLWRKGWAVRTAVIMMFATLLTIDLGLFRFYW